MRGRDSDIPAIWDAGPAYVRRVTVPVPAARVVAAVENIDPAGVDERGFRRQVLDVLRRFVPFGSYAFVLTDPTTTVGCSPLAEVPNLATLPELIRLKYLTPLNRWTVLPASGCATLQGATDGRPEQSLIWREHLAGLGVVDVLSLVFADRFGCWGFLDLWREGGRFSDDEIAAVTATRSVITSRLRHLQAAAFTAKGVVHAAPRPRALVLSPLLQIRAQTPQTQHWLAALIPPQSGEGAVPASAYNVAAQLLATEVGVDAHPPWARVHLGGGTWLTLRADRLFSSEPVGHQDIVVTMETSSAAEHRDLFSRAHGLTRREEEVLGHLADGGDTRTLATTMRISELTVQDHLKSIFTKTSTSSRHELLATSSGRPPQTS